MSAATAAALIDLLRDHRLLGAARQAEVERVLAVDFPTAHTLLPELVRRGWLTEYQRDQIARGHGAALRLGPYVITDWLGAGGMGEVFQARQEKLGRVVALKVIRRERLAKPDAVKRFHREIRAAARLDHPNIVRAYDADEIAGTHLLVMEFVPGTDLARVVKDGGPLAAGVAAEYVRQAALGLQHAAEKGLVHRDFKPANLLLTPTGVVKILDMGLARLRADEGDTDQSSTVTREGVVMGSPDFIAPEQALTPRATDIRADLYSLGCTFYFLLTGRVPFPGGETVQKLMRHQLEEPVPIEEERPDATPRIAAVVRRLMAKRPADRFQTPADVAAALADGGPDPAAFPTGPGGVAVRAAGNVRWDEVVTPDDGATVEHLPPRQSRRSRRLGIAGAVGGVVLLLAAVGFLIRATRPPPEVPHVPAPPRVEVPPPPPPSFDEWVRMTRALPGPRQLDVVADELRRKNKGRMIPVSLPKYEGDTLVGVNVLADNVLDVSPLQGFGGLRALSLDVEAKCALANLDGLRGLKLTYLKCETARVTDLSPLRGMPLEELSVSFNPDLKSLEGLRGLKLKRLKCERTQINDLGPLTGMPLESLYVSFNPLLGDLTPVADMPLRDLRFVQTGVTDLTPLRKLNLVELHGHTNELSDLAPLAGMTELTVLDCGGGKLKVTDLSPLKGMKALEIFSCSGAAGVTDLTPLRGLPLRSLNVGGTGVADLTPLRDVKTLSDLDCRDTPITDLTPVAGLPNLNQIVCMGCKDVRDLTPLAGSKLKFFYCGGTAVSDLGQLKGVALEILDCANTRVTDLSPLVGMPLKGLLCDFVPERDTKALKAIPTLEKLNGRPPAEVLK